MKKPQLLMLILIMILIITSGLIYFYVRSQKVEQEREVYGSSKECEMACVKKGFEKGECKWPSEKTNEDMINIGYCLIINTKHCGNEGVCDCYCLNNPLIGGCAGVSADYTQECCDNWAKENNIFKVQCVGKWEINNNQCSWACYV